MSAQEIGPVILTLCVLLVLVHLLGLIFERLKQPRLIGEILAGLALAAIPSLLGEKTRLALDFLSWIGLFLLMFLSGSETRKILAKENHKETAWLLGVGTPLPFFLVLALGSLGLLPLGQLVGAAGEEKATLLVLAIAVAVTSIPVISRIFYDLGILNTRFASLVLGAAVLEDLVLWAVLAVATGLTAVQAKGTSALMSDVSAHVSVTVFFMLAALFLAPRLLRKLHRWRWNALLKSSPMGNVFCVLFFYIAVASLLKVNLVFAAFLAGFGLVGGVQGEERARFAPQLNSISKVATGVFIPYYFAMVGLKLNLGRDIDWTMLAAFLLASSALSLASTVVAAKLAGFGGLDIINLSVTANARGGPGIVLASVAFEAGLINAPFYSTLVLTAILTSQIAGLWLRFVLSRGWPLLSSNPEETWQKVKAQGLRKI